MKPQIVKFTTAQELDVMTSAALNARFTGFLCALSLKRGIPYIELITEAKDIMTNAGIDQEQLTESEVCAISFLNVEPSC